MFSVSLEFEVVKQDIYPTHYLIQIKKNSDEERCTYCGLYSSIVHDRRTRKVPDFSVLNKPLYLMVQIKRYRCQTALLVLINNLLRLNEFLLLYILPKYI